MNKFKLLCLATTILAGCSSFDMQELKKDRTQELPYTFSQFTDIPIPEGSQMDLDRSMMFGRETDWMGKMTFTAPYNVSGVFDFYMEEMPKFNWKELTSVRGSNSVLTYRYNCRVATVQLISNGFRGGTTVIISMAPSPAKRCQRDGSSTTKTEGNSNSAQTNNNGFAGNSNMNNNGNYQQNTGNGNYQQNMGNGNYQQNMNNGNYQQNTGIQSMNTSNKSSAGSLGLGNASNMYYRSNSNGVGQPPRY